MIVDPVVTRIIQVNKTVIEIAAQNASALEDDASMIKVRTVAVVSTLKPFPATYIRLKLRLK